MSAEPPRKISGTPSIRPSYRTSPDALQIALILTPTGAELAFCVGFGSARERTEESREANEKALADAKARLAAVPPEVVAAVGAALGHGWSFRKSWREAPGTHDFPDLASWLAHASTKQGNKASVSRNLTPDELENVGSDISQLMGDLAHAVTPIFEHVYGVAPVGGSSATDLLMERLNWTAEQADALLDLAGRARTLLFAGPPGTGKTFAALALAEALASPQRTRVVQFHPSYSYEDFVEGIRPKLTGTSLLYELRPGVLKDLVDAAVKEPDMAFVLIIDELNRANVPRTFGELLFALEYRGPSNKIKLLYSDDVMYVPANLWVIGTMNTADRSIAFLDAALRRRFKEKRFNPDYDALDKWLTAQVSASAAAEAVKRLKGLNTALVDLLDDDRLIGQSYLMKSNLLQVGYERIWDEELEPVLREHLFTQLGELGALRQTFIDGG